MAYDQQQTQSKHNSDGDKDQQQHQHNESEYDPSRSFFECNICLETAKDAVVSLCGHLFCWPCLHRWLATVNSAAQMNKTCPVCKSAISSDKVIPIYGRGDDATTRQDPRLKLPPRPTGQRTEVPMSSFNEFAFGSNWQAGATGFSFSINEGGFHMPVVGYAYSFPHSVLSYVVSVIQEFTTNPDHMNETEFYFMRLFAILGVFFLLMAIYYL